MPRFRVSYTFVDCFEGDEDAIRKAIRDLSFSTAFSPSDLNYWRVSRIEGGEWRLEARRTMVDELFETSERAALRKFLYGTDLPASIDVTALKVEPLLPGGAVPT